MGNQGGPRYLRSQLHKTVRLLWHGAIVGSLAAGVWVGVSVTQSSATPGSGLDAGSQLTAGQSITSGNGLYNLIMQGDGNLVEYYGPTPAWASGTSASGSFVVMQGDGNLVVYDGSTPKWASNTSGNPGAYLSLGDDGDLVVDSPTGDPLWGAVGVPVQGSQLTAGQSITSPNGTYSLTMQGDGNLVEYSGSTPAWASGTSASGSFVVMQGDGNLVVYDGSTPKWASNTSGNPGAYLSLGDDGDLVVDSPTGDPLWGAVGVLAQNAQLASGQSITSPGGTYSLTMQGDGNLVEYSGSTPVWASGTGASGSFVVMQGDGNLVVYDGSTPKWASNTSGNPGAYLSLGDDGDLVVDSPTGDPLWGAVGVLAQNAQLASGQSITSPGGTYSLTMQGDGNLVEYSGSTPVWASGTSASGSFVVMQGDGDLVVYDGSTPKWASNTSGNPGAYLSLGDDGDLVVDSSTGDPLWGTPGLLVQGSQLAAGQSITSPNGTYSLIMQGDGNLVEYSGSTLAWSSGTSASGSFVVMQGDGNLVVYDGSTPEWASNTSGFPGAYLSLGNDGYLSVLSASGVALWLGPAPPPPGLS